MHIVYAFLFILIVILTIAAASIKDFIIDNEQDLKRFGISDETHWNKDDNAYEDDTSTYGGCDDGIMAEYDPYIGDANIYDAEILERMLEYGHINVELIRHTLNKIMNEQQYLQLLSNDDNYDNDDDDDDYNIYQYLDNSGKQDDTGMCYNPSNAYENYVV